MTSQIGKEDAVRIRQLFDSGLTSPVDVYVFISKRREMDRVCTQTRQLLEEVASLTADNLRLNVLYLEEDIAFAKEMRVEHAPTTVVAARNGARLYYLGVPGGYELGSLVEDLIDVSRGRTEIDHDARRSIAGVTTQTNINVFFTFFCPYSPLVVRAAHKFALENPLIRATAIDAAEFPQIADRFGVLGVPSTVIDDTIRFSGVPGEKAFAERVLQSSVARRV